MRKLATYEGVVENGRVRLPPNADIPEGTRVWILVPEAETHPFAHIATPHLADPDQAKDFEKQIVAE